MSGSLLSFGSLTRTLRTQKPLEACQYCAKRWASKTRSKRNQTSLEVELLSTIPKLGNAGQRVSVAPGYMRNHLYPKRLALYVLRNRALDLDGTLRPAPLSSTQGTGSEPAIDSATLSANEKRRQTEALLTISEKKIVEQLSKLGPLVFKRRTTGKDHLHGSVSSQDVLTALQERGIVLGDIHGTFAGQEGEAGVENGRIKSLGEYVFNLELQTAQAPIIIQVLQE